MQENNLKRKAPEAELEDSNERSVRAKVDHSAPGGGDHSPSPGTVSNTTGGGEVPANQLPTVGPRLTMPFSYPPPFVSVGPAQPMPGSISGYYPGYDAYNFYQNPAMFLPITEQPGQKGNKKTGKQAGDAPRTKKFVRKAAGQVWEDDTLANWPKDDFRIFAGNLGNDVTDDSLKLAFSKYKTCSMARVVRDKRTGKSKGYGFVSFLDAHDFVKALKEMNGKYICNRPCKLTKSRWKDRNLDDSNKSKNS